jgi:oxygen-independent coproporphyrinogen-3 oxidase
VTEAFGCYVHVPFCSVRCDYCDFATWTDRAHLVDEYVDACVEHAYALRRADRLPDTTSVFFGGGTPSLLPGRTLARLLDAIPRVDGAEVTVECNPDSVDEEKLRTYAAAGVNRVSFGVQSMRMHVLGALGRTHDPDNVARSVDAARVAGIRRVNLDLIYGTPGESVTDWEATLTEALALDPEHVSAYALTVEPGTPLGKAVAAGTRAAPDDDDQALKYELADDLLTAAGRPWYEISNWARPGEECRHNLLYWRQGGYAAIGCAAHGHEQGPDGSRRFWNLRTPERYIEAIRTGTPPGSVAEAGEERLDATERAAEAMTLALRTRQGFKLPAVGADDGPVVSCIDELAGLGLVTRAGDRLVLTRPGRLVANDVSARLLGALEQALDRRPEQPSPPAGSQ